MIKKKSQVQEKAAFFSTSQKSKKKKKSKNFFDPQKIIFLSFLNHFEAKKKFSIFFSDFSEVEKKVTLSLNFGLFFFVIFGQKSQKSPQQTWAHKKCGKNRKNFLTPKIKKKMVFRAF